MALTGVYMASHGLSRERAPIHCYAPPGGAPGPPPWGLGRFRPVTTTCASWQKLGSGRHGSGYPFAGRLVGTLILLSLFLLSPGTDTTETTIASAMNAVSVVPVETVTSVVAVSRGGYQVARSWSCLVRGVQQMLLTPVLPSEIVPPHGWLGLVAVAGRCSFSVWLL